MAKADLAARRARVIEEKVQFLLFRSIKKAHEARESADMALKVARDAERVTVAK